MIKRIIPYLLLIVSSCILSYCIYQHFNFDKGYDNLDLTKVSKLMIVAHPDDELLWGGAHLIEDDYLVVCITCGRNKTRANEFKTVLSKTNDQYLMLGYHDKVLGKKSDWKYEYSQIYKEVEYIINLKKWDVIVTHNAQGEYGHIQHKKTNKIVVDIYKNNNIDSELWVFGQYYTKSKLKKLETEPTRISDDLLSKKKSLIEIYKTQKFIKKRFNHMNPYENWERVVIGE